MKRGNFAGGFEKNGGDNVDFFGTRCVLALVSIRKHHQVETWWCFLNYFAANRLQHRRCSRERHASHARCKVCAHVVLTPIFLEETLDFGDAALINKVTVVGFALGNVVGDGGQHHLNDLFTVVGVPQNPAKLYVCRFG